ncbi:MAG TPA: sigma-54 dependent transcriptional regulator [Pyrinomonadaceae bacterium]
MKILLSWIGKTDLHASQGEKRAGLGPIGQVVEEREFDRIMLLCNYDKKQMSAYKKWLATKTATLIEARHINLTSPMDFGEIYRGVIETITEVEAEYDKNLTLVFHLSPGTSAMAAVWILIAKTRIPAELLQSSPEAGVQSVSVPFEISAEFIPDMLRRADEQLERTAAEFSSASEFADIIYQSPQMREIVEQAQMIAQHKFAVLIEGESGTGKELFARAIHRLSLRNDKAFIPVNCGAIPAELIESELFGHKKGAFTGATEKRTGLFKEADGGTIFLDEIGELPLRAQVRLLRVLQENEVTPVGASRPEKIDVRVISATNRNLMEETINGNFREDLFYRLAVFPLYLPPLRERKGDLSLLIDHFLERLNRENTGKFWNEPKRISPAAKNALLNHRWDGNVRELQNTILRALVMTKNTNISETYIRKALFDFNDKNNEGILNRRLGDGFSLPALLSEVAAHYLQLALKEAGNNKSKAAQLVGLTNYQTFDNWLEKHKS